MAKTLIPYARPHQWGNELNFVVEAVSSGWLGSGPFIERFENQLAELMNVRHAVVVSNGTAALHAIYLALQLRPGDEVIFPGFGYLAGANVAIQLGLTPVFADVDQGNFCITEQSVCEALTPRTRAVVGIHTYGAMFEVENLCALLSERNIAVVEDAAEAMGSRRNDQVAGSRGAAGILSFHAAKTITTGEGGAVLTSDDALADRVRQVRSHGSLRERYFHDLAGHNFRMTNIQAALGVAQLEAWSTIVTERQRVAEKYRDELSSLRMVRLQNFDPTESPVIWAVAAELGLPKGLDLKAVLKGLEEHGIEARNGFRSANEHSIYGRMRIATPVSDALAKSVISLPTYPGLSDSEIEYIVSTLHKILVSLQ
jgi:perosamine synthetase